MNRLPQNLTHLTMGEWFNWSLPLLPSSLISLVLGYQFNRSIWRLPRNLRHLELGYNFNQEIDDLPPRLESLSLTTNYNLDVSHIPRTIKRLRIYYVQQWADYFVDLSSVTIPSKKEDMVELPGTIMHCYSINMATYNEFLYMIRDSNGTVRYLEPS